MSSGKDADLLGLKRKRRLNGESEISTSTGSSFASQLGSLINSKGNDETTRVKSKKTHIPKDDIFTAHHRKAAAAKRARREAHAQQPFGQQHTVDGEGLDRTTWQRSQRRMEEKARLYSAMKRGDVEDMDERYAVDFDRKWAEGDQRIDVPSEDDENDEDNDELVEYVDEFGRTRQGTKTDIARQARRQQSQAAIESDRFTARPTAPTNVIYGDAIQHQAFDPDAPVKAAMEALAKKRDRSLTPPPETHFDATQEIRTRGTGFFQFSNDAETRKKQMDELEQERVITERKRREREQRLREEVLERDREFREDDDSARQKRKADDFLKTLDREMGEAKSSQGGLDAMQRIEAALAAEVDND